ncbi:alpha/beta fold hydrolase [Shewanella intestini]|uniref:Alpha/beta fold hydrolase n=2 Tax=Shewanellaceae TaxID=267890 RepID=A0ABS5I074_9GAMM|nr:MULTISPECIES: alpha/beta fold hydrolase [Shewanella]MBR9727326.1 alpha/beta fold hydrolase [Shewanella intestini]MRG35624.1 alpha/beta hydrolase fold domain-containing protein [Shewanella sp. XMDDZSB0408]
MLDGNASDTLIVFAHGAGANMHHAFMQSMTHRLVNAGFQVLRFNFQYMQANMTDGKRRPAERVPKLLAHYEAVLAHIHQLTTQGKVNCERVVLMGKSMGGRMSALLMSSEHQFERQDISDIINKVSHVICLGYPFVPQNGGAPRLAPLNNSNMATLIIQGERDSFGNQTQLPQWPLRDDIEVKWLTDGDHSLVPRKSSGVTLDDNLDDAIAYITEYLS